MRRILMNAYGILGGGLACMVIDHYTGSLVYGLAAAAVVGLTNPFIWIGREA